MPEQKVTSRKSISFPSLGWSIKRGESKELPKDKQAQDAILAHRCISAEGKGSSKKSEPSEEKTDK